MASSTGRIFIPTTESRFRSSFLPTSSRARSNGWDKRPKVQLQVRHLDEKFVERFEDEWPIARTEWTKFYLAPRRAIACPRSPPKNSAKLEFEALGDGLTFISAPLAQETEITGPLAAKLFVSSSTTDADLFLVFKVYTPDLREVIFHGSDRSRTRRLPRVGCGLRIASSIRR